jgi:hypothetical protein
LRCSKCRYGEKPDVIDWPSIDELVGLVKELGMSGTARKLRCADNSIRRHLVKYGVENVNALTPFNNGRGKFRSELCARQQTA